jgi:hypothetical protein
MMYYEYTAFYQDGGTVHHLSFVAAVPSNQILSQGLDWFRGVCWKALNKRVQTTALMTHWVVEIPAADVSDMAIYPAAKMKAIYSITTI